VSVPESTSDVLSDVLRELRFHSAAYRWLELGEPYRIGFTEPGLCGVHLIASGTAELVVGSAVSRLATGDTVILPRGDGHELRTPGAAAARCESGFALATREPGTRLRAGGPGAAAVIVCGAFLIGEPEHPALRGLPRVLLVPGADGRPQPWLAPYVEALRAEAFDGGAGSDVILARLSDALLVRTIRHHAVVTDRPGWLAGLRDPHLATALAALHSDPAHPWTLAALAARAGLSRTAFAARFTAAVGEPAMTYLLGLRLHHARTLLRDERLTVAAVASRVGYGSDVAFAAAFRRAHGLPPAAWRRAHTTPSPGQ
jgi:AraC-like DNA-binding protein